MAHKKAGGSTALGRDSHGQRLGAKKHDGQLIKAGQIIYRQRGTRMRPGNNVKIGQDDTLYAAVDGVVKFQTKKVHRFNGQLKAAKYVHVEAGK